MWKTFREEPIASIRDFVRDAARDGQAVHIGTDSQQAGRLAYVRESARRIASLRERLLREVWRSVSLGIELEAVVPGDLTVHIDANPVVTHKSSAHVQELVGLVVGQGFKAAIKPEAWAATHCADRVVRGLVGAA